MKNVKSVFAISSILLVSTPAMADDLNEDQRLAGQIGFQGKIESGSPDGPLDRSLKSAPRPEIQLLATETDKVVSLGWSYSLSPSPYDGAPSSNELSFDQFSLNLTTAIDSDGETQLFGIDGFSGGTEVKLSWTRFWGKIGDPQIDLESDAGVALIEAALETAKQACREHFRGSSSDEIVKNCDEESEDFVGVNAFIERYNFGSFAEVHNVTFPNAVFPFLGIEVSGNQDNFSYLDTTAFSIESDSKFGYNAGIFGGILLANSPTSLSAGFNYSRRFKKQSDITLCQNISPTREQCLTAANGKPSVKKAAVFSLEARHAFGLNKGKPAQFAIAPEFAYDIKNEAYSIDVPLYFFPDDKNQLKGGIRATYTNERDAMKPGMRKDDFTLGLFVGVPFSLPF